MSFDINNNIASLQAQNYLNANSAFQAKTIQRVTSGLRIIDSGDDAAGLAIANGMRSDSAVLTQGIRNANDGLSTLQTIDGGINNISGLLDRARTLATQSATGTMTDAQRVTANSEFQNVLSEINRQAQAIGMTAGGNNAKDMSVFVGGGGNDTANATAADKIANGSVTVDLSKSLLDTTSLGLSGNGVQGAVITAGSAVLSGAVGTPAGNQYKFSGAGFNLINVDLTSTFTSANVTNETQAVNVINAGIQAAAASNPYMAAANIRASVDSTGHLAFTGSGGFSVVQNGAQAQAMLGSATTLASASSSAANTWTGAAITAGSSLTFNWRDSSGTAQSKTVALTAGWTLAQSVAAVTGDSTLSTAGIFAEANPAGGITFINAGGGDFSVTSAGGNTNGIAAGTTASTSTVIGNATPLDISNTGDATNAVTALATAVANLGTVQGTVGRSENQLGYAVNLAQSQLTNQTAAEAQIRDADLATEAANLTKAQILLQAGTAALAQANSAPQIVLSLLKG